MTVALTSPGTVITTTKLGTLTDTLSEIFTLPEKGTTIIIPEDSVTGMSQVEPEVTNTVTVEEQLYTPQCIRRSQLPYSTPLASESLTTGYEDYRTWGCSPGTICCPLDRCYTEPLPERNYFCAPERCKPAPPVIEFYRYYPGKTLRNVTLQLPYFPIDPTIFGLDDRIWYPIIGEESLQARDGGNKMGDFEEKRNLASRQVQIEEVTGLGVCVEPCRESC